jgi:hypothetical protein
MFTLGITLKIEIEIASRFSIQSNTCRQTFLMILFVNNRKGRVFLVYVFLEKTCGTFPFV